MGSNSSGKLFSCQNFQKSLKLFESLLRLLKRIYKMLSEISFSPNLFMICTGWPVKHGRVFLVPFYKWLVHCTLLNMCPVDKSLLTVTHGHVELFTLYKNIILFIIAISRTICYCTALRNYNRTAFEEKTSWTALRWYIGMETAF